MAAALSVGVATAADRSGESGAGPDRTAEPSQQRGHKNPGPFCKAERATIVGTKAAEKIRGTNRRDIIVGLGGGDVIRGRGGNDLICGSGGDDEIAGGGGKDEIRGGRGDDDLGGQGGNDKLRGNGGNDNLDGGPARDNCNGGAGEGDTERRCEGRAAGPDDVPVVNLAPSAPDHLFESDDTDPGGPADRNAIGNTRLVVESHLSSQARRGRPSNPMRAIGGSLLDGATDPEGDPLQISSVAGSPSNVATEAQTDLDGRVTVAADGSFTYDPPAGVTDDTDTFTYEVSDDQGNSDSGTVSIEISDLIWFVNSQELSNGNGTSVSPFDALSEVNGTDPDGPGDVIYLHQGFSDNTKVNAYQGGIVLEDDQHLVGQGVDLVVDGSTLIGSAGRADITSDFAGSAIGHGIILADGVDVSGIRVIEVPQRGVEGIGVEGVVIRDLVARDTGTHGVLLDNLGAGGASFPGTTRIAGAGADDFDGGSGISVSNAPSGQVTFEAVDVDDADGRGIQLFSNGASVEVGGGDISGSDSSGVQIRGGAGNVTIDATFGADATNRGVSVVGRTGGTVAFGDDITDSAGRLELGATGIGNSAGSTIFNGDVTISTPGPIEGAIDFDASVGHSYTFSGAVDIDSTTGNGVKIANGGTVTFNGGIDVDTTSGIGLQGSGTTTLNVCADDNCSAAGGTAVANTIDTTTGIGVDLDNTTIGGEGFTFDSISTNGASSGIDLDSVSGSNFQIAGTGSTAGSGGTIQNSTGDGIEVTGTTAPVVFRNMNIDDSAFSGADLDNSSDVTFNGTSIDGWGATNDVPGIDATSIGALVVTGPDVTPRTSRINNTGNGRTAVDLGFGGAPLVTVQNTDVTDVTDGLLFQFGASRTLIDNSSVMPAASSSAEGVTIGNDATIRDSVIGGPAMQWGGSGLVMASNGKYLLQGSEAHGSGDGGVVLGGLGSTAALTAEGSTFSGGLSGLFHSVVAGGTICSDLNAADVAANRNTFSSSFGLGLGFGSTGGENFQIAGMTPGAQTPAAVKAFIEARNDGTASAAPSNYNGIASCALPQLP